MGSSRTIHLLGLLASIGVLALAWYIFIEPNLAAADDYGSDATEVSQHTTIQNSLLMQYQFAAGEPEELESELSELRSQIPVNTEVGEVQRQVVENLGPNVELLYFSHGAPSDFSTPEGNPVSLIAPEVPFEIAEGESTADEPSGVQSIPIEMRVSANSTLDLMNFLDRVENDDRLVLTIRVSGNMTFSDDEGSTVEANIHAYAFSSE